MQGHRAHTAGRRFLKRLGVSLLMAILFGCVLGLLVEAGFSYALAHKALHALGSMPLGFVQELFSPAASGGNLDVDAAEEAFEEMSGALPHMMAMVAAEIHANDGDVLGWCDSRREFEFTLDLLLDGLERQRRESTERRRPEPNR